MDIYNREIRTDEFLNQALDLIKTKLKINANDEYLKDKENAQKLQDFFNVISGLAVNDKDLVSSLSYSSLVSMLDSIGINTKFSTKLIDKQGIKSEYNAEAFEFWINNVIQKTFDQSVATGNIDFGVNPSTGKNYKKRTVSSVIGSEQVNLLKNFDEFVDATEIDIIKRTYKNASQKFNEDYNKEGLKDKYHVNLGVFGKVDVVSKNIDFTFTGEPDSILSEILYLLKDASFSAKGYITNSAVRLGQTNPFRVFNAVIPTGSAREKQYRFHRMLNCMRANHDNTHATNLAFYQLRYIYELMGYGLQYSNQIINDLLGNTSGAKYLIYYQQGKPIKVLATSAIIHDMLFAIQSNSLFQNSNIINQEFVLYGILKIHYSSKSNKFEFGE